MIEKNPNTEKAWVSKYIIPVEQFMTNDDDMNKIYQLGKCKLVDGVRANLSKYDKQKHLEVEFDPNKKALLLYATPVIIKTAVPADIPIGDVQLLHNILVPFSDGYVKDEEEMEQLFDTLYQSEEHDGKKISPMLIPRNMLPALIKKIVS